MSGSWSSRILILWIGVTAGSAMASATDPVSAVQVLREGGCGGVVPASRALRHELSLDAVAQQWAEGTPLAAAAERAGYPALATAGLYVSSTDSGVLEVLRRSACRSVTGPQLRALGVYRRGIDSWIVLTSEYRGVPVPAAVSRSAPAISWAASPSPAPPATPAPATSSAPATSPAPALESTARISGPRSSSAPFLASQALQLVNDVRSRGARCGNRTFAPAPPLTLSGTLGNVAFGHAIDMAEHDYFEHRDLNGQSPADRVRAVGYHEKLVGENIAYGPKSVEEVVQGWLDSPGHCENIMDGRFSALGLAYAQGRSGRHGLYWVMVLAEPAS